MSPGKTFAVVFIFIVTSIAWLILGAANTSRTQNVYSRLAEGGGRSASGEARSGVEELWGEPQTQSAPRVATVRTVKGYRLDSKGKRIPTEERKTDYSVLSSTNVTVNLDLKPRRKGLLWYSTYKVDFNGRYTFKNEYPEKRVFYVTVPLPAGRAVFHNVNLKIGGKQIEPPANLSEGMKGSIALDPGQKTTLDFSYGTQGLDTWNYLFGSNEAISSVRDFRAVIRTNTREVDFPKGAISPTEKHELPGGGWELVWASGNMIAAGSNIGIAMPQKLNPGPLAAKLSFFAPVSLFFFFAVLLILSFVRDIRLHPMHFLFMAAAFFAFHLLFSYLVDHVTPLPAFVAASVVSLLLVVSYVRLFVGWKFAVMSAGLWQFVFLVLFAYAFFFEGYTGLTITIGAIITLAVLMQMTGRVDWDEKLKGRPGAAPPAPVVPPPAV